MTADVRRVVSYSYRDVKNINLDTFRADLAESKLFQCSDDLDADTAPVDGSARTDQTYGQTMRQERLSLVVARSSEG